MRTERIATVRYAALTFDFRRSSVVRSRCLKGRQLVAEGLSRLALCKTAELIIEFENRLRDWA